MVLSYNISTRTGLVEGEFHLWNFLLAQDIPESVGYSRESGWVSSKMRKDDLTAFLSNNKASCPGEMAWSWNGPLITICIPISIWTAWPVPCGKSCSPHFAVWLDSPTVVAQHYGLMLRISFWRVKQLNFNFIPNSIEISSTVWLGKWNCMALAVDSHYEPTQYEHAPTVFWSSYAKWRPFSSGLSM